MIRALLRRPDLWSEAVRFSLASAAPGWWRRAPFLPVPESTYLAWRTTTAYGRDDAPLRGEDIVDFLDWRRRERRSR